MIYSEISLEDVFKDVFKCNNDESYISNLSRINVFIGSNNSGKSYLLRNLFNDDSYRYKTQLFDVVELKQMFSKYNDYINSLASSNTYRLVLEKVIKEIKFKNSLIRKDDFKEFDSWFKTYEGRVGLQTSNLAYATHQNFKSQVEEKTKLFATLNSSYSKVYVPVLRGLRPIQFDANDEVIHMDNYLERTTKDFKWEIKDKDSIFTGLTLYNDVRNQLLGSQKQREKIRKFELFLQENFFFGKEVNLVPRFDEDVLHVKIGEDERPIYSLGDGIQSIIILTYPLFFHQDEYTVFYFEEPETHLHPGLQRIFIETLLKPEFSKFQYFFTTHSNHFLDLTLEFDNISVYTFEKQGEGEKTKFQVRNVNHGDESVLALLGVRNSSVFLSNCTIWVEGITDRLYIRKYLELYQKDNKSIVYKEDLHYSFVEYGGGNITHWSFLEPKEIEHANIDVDRLCGKLMLISDSDNATGKKSERQLFLQRKLGKRYICLPVNEIENLLTKEVIEKTILSYPTNKSGLNFEKFYRRNHANQKLGKFIDENVGGLKGNFADKSGTINGKVNFCKKAIANIQSFEEMSEDAKDLAKRIYGFIKENNQ